MNTPQQTTAKAHPYRHHWLFLIWLLFTVLYFSISKYVQRTGYISVHCPLDDCIPFCKYFIIPYCLWFLALGVMTVYLAFRDVQNFKKYMAFVMIGMIPAYAFFVIFPTGVDFRPAAPEGNGLCELLLRAVYSTDGTENVSANALPSLHVVGCIGLFAAASHTPSIRRSRWYPVLLIADFLIAISTVFVKQHSILDVFAALPWGGLAWWFVYDLLYADTPAASAVPEDQK